LARFLGFPYEKDALSPAAHSLFALLSPAEQAEAIKRLFKSGMATSTISAATRLSIEQIDAILAERQPPMCEGCE
jgi:hypothetical protein